jgi:hypothetical protein
MLPWEKAWSLPDLLGKLLRAQFAETINEPLPKRWVELIHYLNAQEREHWQPQDTQSREHGVG